MINVKQHMVNYAVAAYELGITRDMLYDVSVAVNSSPELKEILANPSICHDTKEAIMAKISDALGEPAHVKHFLMYLCRYDDISELDGITAAYDKYANRKNGVLPANLYCVTPPTESQEEQIRDFLRRKFHREEVDLEVEIHKDLIGGFVLKTGDVTYDRSVRGAMLQMARKVH